MKKIPLKPLDIAQMIQRIHRLHGSTPEGKEVLAHVSVELCKTFQKKSKTFDGKKFLKSCSKPALILLALFALFATACAQTHTEAFPVINVDRVRSCEVLSKRQNASFIIDHQPSGLVLVLYRNNREVLALNLDKKGMETQISTPKSNMIQRVIDKNGDGIADEKLLLGPHGETLQRSLLRHKPAP
jgi:hypothetical protein